VKGDNIMNRSNEFRKVILEGRLEYSCDGYSHSGNVRLIDYHWGDIHNVGLKYIPVKRKSLQNKEIKTSISATHWPHEECKDNVIKISDCAHLQVIDKCYKDFIKLLRQREKDGYGSIEFDLNTLIEIKTIYGELFKFEGSCDAGYVKIGRDKEKNHILKPDQKIYMAVRRKGKIKDPFSYFIEYLEMPGNNIIKDLNIKVFHHSDMIKAVKDVIGNYSEELNFIFDPLYGAISVTILGTATGFFREGGEENFNSRVIEGIKEPQEKQNEVIINMLKGCKALNVKKKTLMNKLSIHPF
jgi:hypothetical protein